MNDTYKVWCKECYETMRKNINNEYGKGNWYFNNLTKMMKFDKSSTITCYPPALAIKTTGFIRFQRADRPLLRRHITHLINHG